jgi:hypothetical protein
LRIQFCICYNKTNMPNIEDDSISSSPKTPRKRAVRRVATKTASPTVRQARPASVAKVVSGRKAPVRLETLSERSGKSKTVYIVAGVFLVIFAAAAWIGFSDDGQIDVTARVNESNNRSDADRQRLAEEQAASSGGTGVVIPVQETYVPPVIPESSLSGRGVGTPVAGSEAVAPVVEENLESPIDTESAATSTTEGTEGVVESKSEESSSIEEVTATATE